MPKQHDGGRSLSRRTIWSALLILLVIPATIGLGIFVLDDRKYYFISLLIIGYTMIPFALTFEARKPQARELIVIAVLAAIAVAGRGAFFMLPQFKPVAAIVIIAGVCFGAEAGFLVGAAAAFVSNFFFGQGPWTPWQMFGFGIIGFAAGILFKKGWLRKSRLSLCFFGGLATWILYGGLINLSSVLMVASGLSREALLAAYASGFWFDLVHAGATVFFLFLIGGPMIEKLERIKHKYGLLDP
ncbi:energy-coupling factor transport system substrate-specific component [Paenibacillus sp. UNCCL117]|uniref:ECF transporter S component n=1 Tax=unclassified Paenibacillus TaxID=185978 RepID=UPI000888888E|nr:MULTISPECIES: ECF transporter S component [unclassified Paenibacillus]SDE10707.1 energy-coupling factor transport system substrate-specific component [Paenibacillus sp. cl123]SFW59828.1 energy-coupling factor transport system substrate-specific component [Paenibacillus sp. UNCCL117]